MDLQLLLPAAVTWGECQAAEAAAQGQPLPAGLMKVARDVGVRRPENIRVKRVEAMPLPQKEALRRAAAESGLLGAGAIGLTLGYSIFVIRGHDTVRLMSHECRHVYQYETLGSIEAFLSLYLRQILSHGYENAPLEIDARAHEVAAIV